MGYLSNSQDNKTLTSVGCTPTMSGQSGTHGSLPQSPNTNGNSTPPFLAPGSNFPHHDRNANSIKPQPLRVSSLPARHSWILDLPEPENNVQQTNITESHPPPGWPADLPWKKATYNGAERSALPARSSGFDPKSMLWYSQWEIVFAKTMMGLSDADICTLFKYRWVEKEPTTLFMQVHHVKEIWDILNDGHPWYVRFSTQLLPCLAKKIKLETCFPGVLLPPFCVLIHGRSRRRNADFEIYRHAHAFSFGDSGPENLDRIRGDFTRDLETAKMQA